MQTCPPRTVRTGFLAAAAFYPTAAHSADTVDRYLEAAEAVFGVMRQHLDRGTLAAALHGPVAHSGFARLT